MGKTKNNKKNATGADEIFPYASKEEEKEFLNFSDEDIEDSNDESKPKTKKLPKKKAYEVVMSDVEMASDDETNDVDDEEDDEDDDEDDYEIDEECDDDDIDDDMGEVGSDEETLPDRKDSRELSKFYSEQNERTVFVGNITPKVTPKVLIQLFNSKKAAGPGAVESARIRGAVAKDEQNNRNAKRRTIIQKKLEDDQVLCAFVVLKKKEDVEKCLSLNNHLICGKHIRVDVIRGKKMSYKSSNSIFIGNIPYDCNEEQVREAFDKCGGIVNVRLVRSKVDGKVKGFGYVEFQETMGVDFSMKMNGKLTIGDRQIRIERCSAEASQKQKRKVKDTVDKSKGPAPKKRKIVVPTNMRSLELNEYIKSKNHKKNKKVIKKKAFIKDKKEKSKKTEK